MRQVRRIDSNVGSCHIFGNSQRRKVKLFKLMMTYLPGEIRTKDIMDRPKAPIYSSFMRETPLPRIPAKGVVNVNGIFCTGSLVLSICLHAQMSV